MAADCPSPHGTRASLRNHAANGVSIERQNTVSHYLFRLIRKLQNHSFHCNQRELRFAFSGCWFLHHIHQSRLYRESLPSGAFLCNLWSQCILPTVFFAVESAMRSRDRRHNRSSQSASSVVDELRSDTITEFTSTLRTLLGLRDS